MVGVNTANIKETSSNKRGVLVIGGIILLVVLSLIYVGTRNSLVGKDEAVSQAWSNVESQYQRRVDLVPNLVEVVKGYADHEKDVLVEVSQARASVGQAKIALDNAQGQITPEVLNQYATAQQNLGTAISRLLLVQERYPELKADTQFINLQHELTGTENRIQIARQRFNEKALSLNYSVRRFPSSIVATIAGIKTREYFDAEEGADVAPKIDFDTKDEQ